MKACNCFFLNKLKVAKKKEKENEKRLKIAPNICNKIKKIYYMNV